MSKEISSTEVSLSSSPPKSIIKTKLSVFNPNSIKKIALCCPDCGIGMSLREGRYGLSYFCNNFPVCRGSHKASKRGKPLGFPADKETRLWRIRAHKALEVLYVGSGSVMTKTEAYGFLAYSMGLKIKQAHISRLNLKQCKVLVALLDFPQ